jgi:transposase
MAMSAIAQFVDEPDSNLWRIFRHYVDKSVENEIDMSKLKRVCIDETAIKRGHSYVSIFTDYDTGYVIFVADGRKSEVFSEFKKELKKKGGKVENIELFSMDMSKSYKAGSKQYFEKAKIVFDRFHIKKAINEAVDKVRRQEAQETDELLKTKYIWLKNERNLTRLEEQKINDFLYESSLNTPKAYQVKQEFDELWNIHSKATEAGLHAWIKRASSLALEPINKFIKTLYNNWDGILQSMKTLITNAVAEGINSKVQNARSRARGYRNYENYKTMIYFIGNDFNLITHLK